ncbi:MAG: hypothetical protein A3E94_01315 [Candidatus Zambryskibacteria bacterium RIFCSPHIGHO2_12_FULL_44_12b]|uniref:Helix-turn-helix domain-containing protein n=1 Tax=Candidatus Zambryskibacteria bacterium RIFCSPLOWO2_01_FULL_45_21 TaxID=1802761 RepID=A0A1G2U3R8_9BACT|nr:MAG: hypothetical protein A3E94_01315 [Candidatus Zambryskibacteria bacterium RIFCSPHIGHO2_12_FULL_44_12b]OHB03472.1 MAG: hypothetical protein A3B14_02995 [Candidatus Zambryskibacteria bacterium RIFCSPLOWO2_01_FULL_45_21]
MNGDLFFEDKKYISSKRAAQISGYANDYIGELCRANKIDSRMVGRSWYVSLDSILWYKETLQNEPANVKRKRGQPLLKKGEVGLQTEYDGIDIEKKDGKKYETTEHVTALKPDKLSVINSVINYESDDSPLIPLLNQDRNQDTVASILVTEEYKPEEPEVYAVPFRILEDKKEDERQEVLDIRKIPSPFMPPKTASHASLNRKLTFTFALMILIIGSMFLNFQFKSIGTMLSMRDDLSSRFLAQSKTGTAESFSNFLTRSFGNLALSFYRTINGLTTKSFSVLVFNDDSNTGVDKVTEVANPNVPVPVSKGMVVISAPEDKTEVEKTIESIKESFSDEVIVRPDGSGTSGIIQPVFKEVSGDEYIYVLVPVGN